MRRRRAGVIALALALAGGWLEAREPDAYVAQYCVSCHGPSRRAGGVSLDDLPLDGAAGGDDRAERVIRVLRAGLMPPRGAPAPPRERSLAFVQALEAAVDAASAPDAAVRWRPFQRLNRAEYANAVRDLLAIDVDVTALLPDDPVGGGFDTIAEAQTLSPLLVTGYLRAARQVSERALAAPASRARVLTCRPRSPRDEDACARRIIRALQQQAFRGFATAEDAADALSFYRRGRAGATFADGIRAALEATLVSPRFVFRLEPLPAHASGVYRIGDLALASRLSFFLWSAPPDARLVALAAKNRLSAPPTLAVELARMLRDPRAAALAARFGAQWLRLPDPDGSPLSRAMRTETELVLAALVREDRSILDLLTFDTTFVNGALARLYGIDGISGERFRRAALPPDRHGILGQASVLVSTSLANRTSPVLRGKWVMEVLLGTPPPPPPPNVPALDDSAAPVRNGRALTTRERVEQHRRNPACSSCHRVIDPFGMPLEVFDAGGASRATEHGQPVEATVELFDGTMVAGPAGLRQAILDRKDLVLRTFAEALLRYATGRLTDHRDMPEIRRIVARAARADYRVSAFVRAVVDSAAFRKAVADAPREGPCS